MMPEPTKTKTSRATILLVDDDPEMRCALERVLVKDGYTVLAFSTATRAWETIEAKRPFFQLVISDVRMPGMSGLSFLDRVKSLYPNVPIILITAYGEPRQRDESLRHGAYRYLYKPLPSQVLLSTVRLALGLPKEAPPPPTRLVPAEPDENSDVASPNRARGQEGFQEIKNMDEWLEKLDDGDPGKPSQ